MLAAYQTHMLGRTRRTCVTLPHPCGTSVGPPPRLDKTDPKKCMCKMVCAVLLGALCNYRTDFVVPTEAAFTLILYNIM